MGTEKRRILIVEDEKNIAMLLSFNLGRAGFDTDVAEDGEIGLRKALSDKFDIVLLDIMLPKLDGFKVLEGIRTRSNVPVIMVTARDDEKDKILFSADAFGTFGALAGNIFDDEITFDDVWMNDARRYYTNIVGKYGVQVQAQEGCGTRYSDDLPAARPDLAREPRHAAREVPEMEHLRAGGQNRHDRLCDHVRQH